jgi:hypothetical protein
MLKSKPIAESICTSGENLIAILNQALHDPRASSTPEAFEEFKRAVGHVIGTLDGELLAPLYQEHPDLEPESLRGRLS